MHCSDKTTAYKYTLNRNFFKAILLSKLILINAIWETINQHFAEANFNLSLEIVDPVRSFSKVFVGFSDFR